MPCGLAVALENHLFGLFAETLFIERCHALGLRAARGPMLRPYDLTLTTADGRELKIQIKATQTIQIERRRNSIRRVYLVPGIRMTKTKSYYADCGVDFLAIFVKPQSRWYIIPASEVRCNRVKIAKEPKGRMKTAIERWDYFTGIANAAEAAA